MKTALISCISLILLSRDPTGLSAQDSGARATFSLNGVSFRSSLDSLMKWFPVFIVYLDRDVEGKTATASCTDCRFEEALDRLLAGTPLSWTRQGSQYVLRVREPARVRSLATLFEGARIYNPSHFGGVLSTFNAETLNDVQAVVGGLPPYYGDDIGGILDLSVREGNSGRLSGSAGSGSLGSSVSLEGPLSRGATFIASVRRGYPDAAVPFLGGQGTPGRLGSDEAIAKVTQRLSAGSTISLSGYLGRDSYTNDVAGAGERLGNDFSWGNRMINLRWFDIASPSVFLYASADYTRYDFTLGQSLSGDMQFPNGLSLASMYAIEDISVRANAEHYYDEEHTLRAPGIFPLYPSLGLTVRF